MSKELINLSNLQRFLSKLSEKFALKKAMKGISEDAEGNIIIGEEGLVPTPNENSKGKFLRSDGEWALPSETAVYDSMTLEEGVAGVSKVDRVLSAKNLKQIVNSDGFLTSLDSSKLTGVINIENLPQGALERILIVSSKEERLTLLDTEVQLGDVVKESDTGLMYYVINTEKLNSEEGYTQFTAGSASSVPWSGVTDKPTIPTKTSDLTNDSDFAIDSGVVHKSGDETIAGSKTFIDTIKSNLNFYNTSDVLNVEIPYVAIKERTNGVYQPSIVWKDKDSYELGNLRIGRMYSQDTTASLSANTFTTDGKYVSAEVQVVANSNSDGKSYAKAPTPSQSANSNEIVTAEWVNALDENLVHKTGNETISGVKSFNNLMYIYDNMSNKNNQMDLFKTPANTLFSHYMFVDKNNEVCAYMQYGQANTGPDFIGLFIHDKNRDLRGILVTTNNEVIPFHHDTYSLGSIDRKWANAHIGRVVCPRFTNSINDGRVYIAGGSEWDKGAHLVLHGEESNDAGAFIITSKDKTRTIYLVGRPDGTLQWAGQNLITTTFFKGTNYWYRKHSDGFIEMGGFTNGENTPIVAGTNLPIAFSNTDYTLIVQLVGGGLGVLQTTTSKSTTRFEVFVNDMGSPGSNYGGYDWYACGY